MATKSILIKVLGGSAAAAPAIAAGTYAIITQQEYEGLKIKIRTLETKNGQTERSLQEVQEEFSRSDAAKDKQLIEQLGQEKTKLEGQLNEAKRKLDEEESKSAGLFAAKQQLEKDLKQTKDNSNVKSQGLKQWLKEDILDTEWKQKNYKQMYITTYSGSGVGLSWQYYGFCVDDENNVKTCPFANSLSQKDLYSKI